MTGTPHRPDPAGGCPHAGFAGNSTGLRLPVRLRP